MRIGSLGIDGCGSERGVGQEQLLAGNYFRKKFHLIFWTGNKMLWNINLFIVRTLRKICSLKNSEFAWKRQVNRISWRFICFTFLIFLCYFSFSFLFSFFLFFFERYCQTNKIFSVIVFILRYLNLILKNIPRYSEYSLSCLEF